MDIKYRMASYTDYRIECEGLRQLHFLEVFAHRGAEYAVDHDMYEELDKLEMLRIILGYDGDTAVCYMINAVNNDPHDNTRMSVVMDMVFVHPSYRKYSIGPILYRMAQADLETYAPGALWRTTVPIDGAFDSKKRTGLEKFGFKATERVYEKKLGGDV